jgi:hypothetical protein
MKTYLVTVDDRGVETRQEIAKAVVPKGATLVIAPLGGYWDAATAEGVVAHFKALGVTAAVVSAPAALTTEEPAE